MATRRSKGANTSASKWEDSAVKFTGNLEEDEDNENCLEIGGIIIPPPAPPALTFDPTGPRLRISKIEIENFKSYGGKTVLGPFHKNFSSIIGPNGSGKSNVIDAMLFVFGYRAQKIRSKTVGVLIHSSDAFPKCNSCSVSVHFDKIIDKGKDDYDEVPGSSFAVSRVAHKDNTSYYLIGDRRVQFKEVSSLLRSHGIDLDHNRFLILQGEVEQISLMKPMSTNPHETGMLEFLEDLIGTGRLKDPIAQLQQKVDELNERRSEKLSRLKTAEADKDELEALKNEALRFIEMKNDAVMKKHTLTQHSIFDCSNRLKASLQKLQTNDENNEAFLSEFNALIDEIKTNEVKVSEVHKKYDGIAKLFEANKEKFAQLDLEDVSNREDIKHCKDKIKRLHLNVKKEIAKIEELEKIPEKFQSDIEELQEAKTSHMATKEKAEDSLSRVTAGLKTETAEIQSEKDNQEKILFEEQTIVNSAKSKVDLALSELDLYTNDEDIEKTKLDGLRINLSSVERNVEDRKKELLNLKEEIPKLKQEKERCVKDLKAVSDAEPEVAEKFRLLRNKLEDSRNSVQNQSSRNRLVGELMKEKAEQRIPGIIGRLGDLGGIDAKYDVAVSTACPQLDNIVTDTLDTAMLCVEFLRKHNLGQATFIALDKMDVWQQYVGKKIITPRNVPRLFDLIKVNDKSLLPAFYFVMRDTLVAENIDQATEIGLRGTKRFRVVTLKGELVEISGTMSGGGSRPMRGRMGTSAVQSECSPEELLELERKLSQLQQEREDLKYRKSNLEETILRLEQQLERQEHTVQRYEMEIEAMEKQRVALKPQIKEQENRYQAARTDPKKVVQLKTILEERQKELAMAEKVALKSKARVQELHERIMEIGCGKLKSAQKLVSDAALKLNQVVEEINKKTVAITTSQRNCKKAVENKKKFETEIVELQDKYTQLKDKIQAAEDAGRALTTEKEEIESQKVESEAELKEISRSLKKLRAAKAAMEGKNLDIQNERETIQKDVNNVKAELKAWQERLLKIKPIEMEGIELQPFSEFDEEQLAAMNHVRLQEALTDVEDQLKGMKPNLGVIAQYKEKEQLYLQRVEEFDSITKDRNDMRKCYDELRKRRFNEFMNGFTIIARKLKETYQMLTLGGDADLELVNSLDPFSDGILFTVRPPRKSWKNISNLSGGEKTLSSLSLVFALHYYKPTPFYIMDEIDAALDFRNVAIVAHYIKEQTKNAQFIVVSLRENMFEQANRLVGVYKTHDTSHSACIDISRYESVASN